MIDMSRLGVSATEAILHQDGQERLRTSSQRLDDAFLGPQNIGVQLKRGNNGGIARGTVGEIVGPPGSGKTALA